MKKRFVALICIVVLLLWPLAGCKKPSDSALDGVLSDVPEDQVSSGNKDAAEIETNLEDSPLNEAPQEEKIYCTATLEDEFKTSEVILTLKSSVSDPYTVSDAVNFSHKDYEIVVWKNRYDAEKSKDVDFSGYRQVFLITLKVRTKENVLSAIKELEQLDYVYSAEPNYNIEEEFSVVQKFGPKETLAEEKMFCTTTMNGQFEPGEVLVLLTHKSSDLYTALPSNTFSCIDYETVIWENKRPPEILNKIDISKYRQRYTIILKEKTKQAVLDAIKELEKLDFVYCAEPNHIFEVDLPIVEESSSIKIGKSVEEPTNDSGYHPSDTYINHQYAIEKMSLPAAWHISNGTANTIKVGILDSGIDRTHPDLNIPITRWGYNFTGDGTDAYVATGKHGTHVAGIVGAIADNVVGISGVSWNVELYSLKVFYQSGVDSDGNPKLKGNSNYVASAIEEAGNHQIYLLNYSGGGSTFNPILFEEISQFPGLLIAAAGNDGDCINENISPFYPASYDCQNIISVAATNSNDQLRASSNYGSISVDLAAPGDEIYSTTPNGYYGYKSGTSMAAPQVTGVAALIWSLNPSMTADQVKQAIMNGVDSVSGLSGKCVTGGRLNAFKAVTNVLTNYNPPGVLSGDVTGDGLDDLVVSGNFNGKRKISVFPGQSTGGFGQAVHTFSQATFVYNDTMYIGDVNGDGKDDLVVLFAQNLRRSMAVYTAKGDGTFYERINFYSTRTHDPSYFRYKLFLEDTTGDGKADFVVHWRTDAGKRKFLVYKGCSSNGKGSFNEGIDSTESVFNYVDSDPAYMGDVNGDGRSDFVIHWSENNKRRLLTYTAKADGTFAEGAMLYSVRTHDPNTYPCSFHLADATGDGKMDFLVHWKNTAGKRNIMVYKGISSSGTANFEEGYYALSSTRAYIGTDPVYMGNFNGDGRSDQMVHYAINGIRNMLVYFANASGNYNEAIQISTTQQQNLTTYPCTVHIMNTNGDARDDFVVRYRTIPDWRTAFHAYKGTSSGFAASVPTTANFFPYYIYY